MSMDRSGSAESPFMGSFSSLAGSSTGGRGNVGSPFTSPFLDPSFTRSPTIANEYIFPDGGTKASRGRFEMAFAQIGASIFVGGGIGGTIGFGKGLRDVAKMTDTALPVRRAALLNFITRNAASVGNTFGTIALIYSAIGVGLSFIQDDKDEVNTLAAATTTGIVYGATSQTKSMVNMSGVALRQLRIKRAGLGLVGGLIAAGVITFVMHPEKYRQWSN